MIWCLFRGLVLLFRSSLDWFNQEDATASVWKGCFNVSPRSSLLAHQEGPFSGCYWVTSLEWPRIEWHSWRITRTSKQNSNEPLPLLTTLSNIGGNIKKKRIILVCNVCLCRTIVNACNNNFICTLHWFTWYKKIRKNMERVQATQNSLEG